jgi:hypothetical protein
MPDEQAEVWILCTAEVSDLKGFATDAGGMVTDDMPGRKDTYADFSSVVDAAAAGHGWSTVPADWFDSEPAAGLMRAEFLELYRSASAEQITTALEAIWLMLDRAALWVSSIRTELGGIVKTCGWRECPLL